MVYMLKVVLLDIALHTMATLAQNCGPSYGNQTCSSDNCCSQYGWCADDLAHCDPTTCLSQYSGPSSNCTTPTPTNATDPYASTVPNIDTCGGNSSVSCPGAGITSFFYRCCSSAGHCGPKNNIQNQSLYCGDGCQAGFGKCDTEPEPPNPIGTPGVAVDGDTCGPIVNLVCEDGLCCSGSNYCGNGTDFCGSANWCQPDWGSCYANVTERKRDVHVPKAPRAVLQWLD